jgi:mRNA interferase MazF
MVKRGEIWLAALNPTIGCEIQKTRPCVIVSPAEMHDYLKTVIIAPMTTGNKQAPYRVPITFQRKKGLILLDQIRAIDKTRLIKKMGRTTDKTLNGTLVTLLDVFAH